MANQAMTDEATLRRIRALPAGLARAIVLPAQGLMAPASPVGVTGQKQRHDEGE
jgi:hypothetical protein